MAGFSWCFSCVIHDSIFQLQRYKKKLRFASFFSKILRFNTLFFHKFCYIYNKVSDTTKKGRETGGTTNLPSRASSLCTKAFRAKTGGREGHFEKNFFLMPIRDAYFSIRDA